ncbi:hypothetical protein LEP1GSC016_0240 [Leptospira borgpetersenii serovar Hardjo-bovis str. Sponselee]|uniref:Uncharacterized protein n=1 Tax=Leptospira borgpetersenii serovar Hardjo-bovis str. Sponselee TaxID=1303729 RepID=M6BZJ3_LEPBO|nr:hypothetical protein LEP1GSC016_0240 [Leptospira borgpetersenii serovar Hardjo-bovis str. Sponselee]
MHASYCKPGIGPGGPSGGMKMNRSSVIVFFLFFGERHES